LQIIRSSDCHFLGSGVYFDAQNQCMEQIVAVHSVNDAALALRVFFSGCLVAVFFAGLYVLRHRKEWFGRDPHVTADTWASRNLRLWQVLLVWVLAMELPIATLFRV
jgi:hypothetical protein